MTRTRKIAAGALLLFGLALYTAARLIPNDWQEEKPRLDGYVWSDTQVTTPTATSPARIYYITMEERKFRHRIGSASRRNISNYRTISYDRYTVELRRAPNGDLTARQHISDIRDSHYNAVHPEILGPVPQGLWLFNNGPELRHPDTLEVVMTSQTLKQRNPDLADYFPSDLDNYRVSATHRALIFRTKDLRYIQVDAATGHATPVTRASMEAATLQKGEANAFRYLPSSGRARGVTSVADFLVSTFLTPNNFFYGLLSEDRLAAISKWPSHSIKPYGDEWRSFYRVPYKLDDRNHPEIDPQAFDQLGELRFLNGAFLQRTDYRVWDVPDPSSTLILHKKDLEKTTPWSLARLTRDGQLLFDVPTTIADLHTVADAGDTVVFYGQKDFTEPTSRRADILAFITTATGKITTHDLSATKEK